jgi:hypothetical protein
MHRMAGIDPVAGVYDAGHNLKICFANPGFPVQRPPPGALALVDFPFEDPAEHPDLLGCLEDIVLLMRPGPEAVARVAACVDAITGMMAARTSFSVRILGGLVTRVGRRTEEFERLMVAVERALPVEVFPFFLPEDPSLVAVKGCLVESAPQGRAARCLVELTMEVQEHEQ